MLLDREELNALYRYTLSLCNDPTLAYDLLQSGIEKSLKSPPRRLEAHLSYVKAIIKNHYFDWLRKENRISQSLLEQEVEYIHQDISSLENLLIQEKEVDYIWSILTPVERELLYYWAIEGYTLDEIARKSDTPKGTLLSRLHRLRKKIIEHSNQQTEGKLC